MTLPNFQGHHTIKTVKWALSAHYLLNQLVYFDQTCIETPSRHGAKIIRFWWPCHIFKVDQHFECPILTKKLVCTRSFQPNNGFWPNFTYCIIGIIKKKLIRFSWSWPNFQGHHTIKTVKMSLVYTLSPESIDGFWPNSKETSIEHEEEMIRFCWPWPHFQGHTTTLNVKFWPKKIVCTLTLEPSNGFWPNFSHCIIEIFKIID